MLMKYIYLVIVAGICISTCGLVAMALQDNNNSTKINETIANPVIPTVNDSKPVVEAPIQNDTLVPIEDMNATYELIPLVEQTYTEELPVEETPVIYEEPIIDEIPETIVKLPAQEKPVESYSIKSSAPVKKEVQPKEVTAPVEKAVTKTTIPSIVCKQIPTGALSFPAPQIYYEVIAGENGEITMGSQFKEKKFILVPIN